MTMPRLALGTAPMMGRISRRRSLETLEGAWALGIRDFDTARSYGWGEAEGLLGAFLKGRERATFRVVTKCGIVPVRKSPLIGAARSAARTVLALVPALRGRIRQAASAAAFQPAHVADVDSLKTSLRTSLGELGLDYVDTLLMHNFEPGKPGLAEVVDWFAELQREGVVRRFGFSVEGDLNRGLASLSAHGCLEDAVVQVPVSAALLSLPQEWRRVTFIAHSPFSFLANEAAAGGKLRTLDDLLKALGEACTCDALVCSMFTRAHLEANVAAWRAVGGAASEAP